MTKENKEENIKKQRELAYKVAQTGLATALLLKEYGQFQYKLDAARKNEAAAQKELQEFNANFAEELS